jgi:hypothetical protein
MKATLDRFEPVETGVEPVAHPIQIGIGAPFQGRPADIGAERGGAGQFLEQCQRDRTGAGAEIENAAIDPFGDQRVDDLVEPRPRSPGRACRASG